MSVQDYLDKHMLSRKIEDAVNAAVRAKTSDPVLFIVGTSLLLISFCLVAEKIRKKARKFWIWCVVWRLSREPDGGFLILDCLILEFGFVFWCFGVLIFFVLDLVESYEESGFIRDHEGEGEADSW